MTPHRTPVGQWGGSRGPYCNEEGDWWFPVDAWSWNEAQHEAALMARESDCVSLYQGIKVDVPLWEDDPADAVPRTAYHFLDVEPVR